MKRMRHRQPVYAPAALREPIRQLGHRCICARNHHGVRAIDRREADPVGELVRNLRLAGGYGHHCPAFRQCCHQPRPSGYHLGGIL